MRTTLLALALMFASQSAVLAQDKLARKPNIVVIVADDLGYADLGCQGCKDIPTPNIDTLAKNGVRCTDGYVSCPVCSPTRAGLLTGRYQQRFGHEFNPGPAGKAEANFGLPLNQKTIADYLKALGYTTGLIGKWHLGYEPQFHPMKRGFDEYFGFLGGAHSYIKAQADGNPIMRGTKPVVENEYLTKAFGREAVAFIDKHQKEPFYLQVTFNAVHAPMQSPDKASDKFASIKDDTRRTFAGMLTALDDAVGAILAKLRSAGLDDNTLIIFFSDNGGPTLVTRSRNDPLRGYKGQTWEGGVRIPFLVQWPGRVPAGKEYRQPIIALDILPTAVAAASGSPPAGVSPDAKIDGVDLLPYLAGKKDGAPHEFLYWRFGPQWSIRQGDWKLTQANDVDAPQLHNLAADIGQSKDVAAKNPEKARELKTAYERWNSELKTPLWKKGKAKN